MANVISKIKASNGLEYDINVRTMTGASASEDGAAGAVPAPSTGDQNKYLRGDGTWANIGGAGHTIVDANGNEMAARGKLQFTNATVTDNAENDTTVVTTQGGGTAIKLADVSGASATSDRGTKTVVLKWTDPEDVEISGVKFATWAGTKVVRKVDSAPSNASDGTVVVNSATRDQYSSNGFSDTGLTYGVTYYYRFFPYSAEGAETQGTSLNVVPQRLQVDVPTVGTQLVYNGDEQTQGFNGYDSTKMTVSGNTGTDAGDYTATFTPLDDYEWTDASRDGKDVAWSIEKASQTITLSADSVTLDADHLSATVTASATGSLSAQSNNTSLCTASLSGSTITIASAGSTSGSTTVTVTAAETDNYNVTTKNITVTCAFTASLENSTWAEISAASKSGKASSYWKVGDTKSVALSGTVGTLSLSTTLYVFILGFDHNSSTEGTGISFGCFKTAQENGEDVCLVDSKYGSNGGNTGSKYFQMNHWGGTSSPYNTNYGGWKGCDARYDILGSTNQQPSGYGSTPTTSRVGYDAGTTTATSPVANTLMAALPSALRAVMKPITKYTDNKGNSSTAAANVTASVDYLPLLSEWEVQGARSYANENEKSSQAQYAYYLNGNSKIKKRHDNTGTAAYWWCRSADSSDAHIFCAADTGGSANRINSRYSSGLAPAFLV